MSHKIFALLVLSIISCNKEQVLKFRVTHFKVGFDISKKFSGSYYDKSHHKTLIYFADPVTAKALKLFDESGKSLYTVDLSPASKYLGDVDDITVIAPDTIIINSQYTNKIAFVNRKGEIWKALDLRKKLIKDSKMYEIHSSTISDFQLNDELLFNCEQRADLNAVSDSDYKNFVNSYTNTYNGNYFVKLDDIYSSDVKVKFGFNLYRNIYDQPSLLIEPSFYKYCNKKLFVTSIFSNTIFEVDPLTLVKTKQFKLHSDFTDIGMELIPLNQNTYQNVQKIVDTYAKSKGFIANIEYDAAHQQYIAVVYHDTGVEYPKISERPFSLIWLDKSFIKKREISVDDKSFTGGFCIKTDDSIIFYSNKNSDGKSNGTKDFVEIVTD